MRNDKFDDVENSLLETNESHGWWRGEGGVDIAVLFAMGSGSGKGISKVSDRCSGRSKNYH